MGCQDDAEYLARSQVAWRRPSRKEVAEQLGGQQAARGRRVSRRALGAKKTPEGPGSSSSQEGAPTSHEQALPSGQGSLLTSWWTGRAAARVERC